MLSSLSPSSAAAWASTSDGFSSVEHVLCSIRDLLENRLRATLGGVVRSQWSTADERMGDRSSCPRPHLFHHLSQFYFVLHTSRKICSDCDPFPRICVTSDDDCHHDQNWAASVCRSLHRIIAAQQHLVCSGKYAHILSEVDLSRLASRSRVLKSVSRLTTI